jgi:NAD(P)-dependent dehydrogenase (short-subunit alcohol dehydrogenase family)
MTQAESDAMNIDTNMNFDLTGRVGIVTGAGQGIGRVIAQTLARHRARILIADIALNRATEVAREIQSQGGEAIGMYVDVTDSASVSTMVERCVKEWGKVDLLVNNAGIVTTQTVEEMPEADWRRVLDVNLTGPFLCCRAVIPLMRKNGGGKIVNVSSVGGRRISYNGGANYTASKAGLLAFTRHLAYELAPYGINVNAICPGPTPSPMTDQLATAETVNQIRRSVPRGRLSTPEDQAKAVLFLVSELADFVCGVALDVDGGLLLGWYDNETYIARRKGGTTARPN